ncbi:hypothetical protein FPQ18DRAFT_392729 [Pyronema domesticum]|nr:hypothetical protein FPQ18DRAFT_392729 [Pyronema domesticum]
MPTHTWTTTTVGASSAAVVTSTAAAHDTGGGAGSVSQSSTATAESSVYGTAGNTPNPTERKFVAYTVNIVPSLEAVHALPVEIQYTTDFWLGQERWEDGVRILNLSTNAPSTVLHAAEVIEIVADDLSIGATIATLDALVSAQASCPAETCYAIDVYLNQTREEDGDAVGEAILHPWPDMMEPMQLSMRAMDLS